MHDLQPLQGRNKTKKLSKSGNKFWKFNKFLFSILRERETETENKEKGVFVTQKWKKKKENKKVFHIH